MKELMKFIKEMDALHMQASIQLKTFNDREFARIASALSNTFKSAQIERSAKSSSNKMKTELFKLKKDDLEVAISCHQKLSY